MHRTKGNGHLKWTRHGPNLPTETLTTPQKVGFIWERVNLKMLDFSDHARNWYFHIDKSRCSIKEMCHVRIYMRDSTGKFQIWKGSELESVRIGKCQNWKVSKLESVRNGKSIRILKCQIRKCQNWKVSELESVRIEKCPYWKVSYSESVKNIWKRDK